MQCSDLISYTVPPPRLEWVDVGGETDMVPHAGYRVKGIGKSVLTLPDSTESPNGCRILVDGHSGGWEIRCNIGQKIAFGSKETSTNPSVRGVRSSHPSNFAEFLYTGQGIWKIVNAVGVLDLF